MFLNIQINYGLLSTAFTKTNVRSSRNIIVLVYAFFFRIITYLFVKKHIYFYIFFIAIKAVSTTVVDMAQMNRLSVFVLV